MTNWPVWDHLVAACAKCKPLLSKTGKIMISSVWKPCARCGVQTSYRIKEPPSAPVNQP